ncbi:MAG TPA: type II toxin-antitoxin system VapC family toxin [Anaeromyxobacter sp.]|nr:type II toxin-antitoxin system VapC family toxin [Anaeromyxobacter sp.]
MIVADTNLIVAMTLPHVRTRIAEAVYRIDPDWVAPLLWRSELRNVLAGALRRGDVDPSTAAALAWDAEDRMTGGEYTVESEKVLRLVATSRCSAYDCEFVALADDLGVPLVTSDGLILKEFPDLARSPEAFVRDA